MTESSNYAKFQTSNPVVRALIDRFYDRIERTVSPLGATSLLDAGCGEGETLSRLARLPARVVAIDADPGAVEFTRARFPGLEVRRESVYELGFADREFDLVICLEVLEHLDDPRAALVELARVTARDLVLSVPHEPWFRAGSLLRGKHVRTLGNHPEHVNRWNRRRFAAQLETTVEVVSLSGSFPWLIAHAHPR